MNAATCPPGTAWPYHCPKADERAKRAYGDEQVAKGMPDTTNRRDAAWGCLGWRGRQRRRAIASR